MRIRIVLVLAALAAACSGPRDADVRAEFLRANPGVHVVSADAGEGDASAVYYLIRYRAPGDSAVRTAEWQYMRQPDGSWRHVELGTAGGAGAAAARPDR